LVGHSTGTTFCADLANCIVHQSLQLVRIGVMGADGLLDELG
jgi:hypothetical protein